MLNKENIYREQGNNSFKGFSLNSNAYISLPFMKNDNKEKNFLKGKDTSSNCVSACERL